MIAFDNVAYSYGGGELLSEISLRLAPGSFHFLTGPSDGRPCRAMYLWSMGGWVLGAVSTLFGPNLIWVCTEAVEETVHHHLSDQLNWLQPRDGDLHDLIKGIQAEEEGHLDLARSEKTLDDAVTRGFGALVRASVATVVWLSTWGKFSQMRRYLARAA